MHATRHAVSSAAATEADQLCQVGREMLDAAIEDPLNRGVGEDQLAQAQQRKGRIGLRVQRSCGTMRERHSSTSRRHREGVGLEDQASGSHESKDRRDTVSTKNF